MSEGRAVDRGPPGARPPAAGGARLLLSRLRALMANKTEDPNRLDRVVELVANTMVADVCSIYLSAEDKSLLLVATQGLRKEAVGRTRLAENEGLVGLVSSTARPKRLTDAFSHPRFSYRPETGEDPFHSFMGVPILRGGRVLGVLVVQNRTERAYDDEEVEALQTIAMVLAELVGSAADALGGTRQTRPAELHGRALNEGLAVGTAWLHDPVVPPARLFAADPEREERRLTEALDALRLSIDAMLSRAGGVLFGESLEVLDTFRLFAHDPSWAARLLEAVRSGLSAEAAVDRVRREHRARLESARDELLRERLHDLEDLENRLLRHLGGDETSPNKAPPGSVLVAGRLGPAELLEYRDADLAAVVLEEAGAGSHAAIVARAMGVPAIGGLNGLVTRVESGDAMIVDADAGVVYARPDAELTANYQARIALSDQKLAAFSRLRGEPSRTVDGVNIALMMNAGLYFDLDHLDEVGGEGIGLFRTEFQFMASETVPGLVEQTRFYSSVLDRAGEKPVVFRTIDLGGDKIAPFMGRRQREENPALGWRALRMALDHPFFFRRQLRALVRAAAGRSLRVMFPMVTTVEEFEDARRLLDVELEWAARFGREPPKHIQVGAMVETPSIAFSIDALEGKADFLSVGTNDLMQFFFASDRDNARVSGRYDLLSLPAMRLLLRMRQRADDAALPITICGEAAGRPVEALALLGLGYTRLSMQATRIGPIKQMVRSTNLAALRPRIQSLVENGAYSIRDEVLSAAAELDVKI